MKQIYIQNTVQNPKGIVDAFSGSFQISSRLKPLGINAQNHSSKRRGVGEALKFGGSNIFLNQNFGKAPPGRSRSPGVGDGLFPDHPPDAKKEVMPNLFRHLIEQNDRPPIPINREELTNSIFENTIHTEQRFYNTQIQNFNYLQTLNFLQS